MSLKPDPIPPIPEGTAQVAQAAFPHGNSYLTLRDELGTIFTDEAFADLFPLHGRPAEAPWRLALVTVMQYLENLTDRQAADAVRSRLDWKYFLSLELMVRRPGLLRGRKHGALHALGLQRPHIDSINGLSQQSPLRLLAEGDAMFAQEQTVGGTGVLAPPIAMMNEAFNQLVATQRHVQGHFD